MGDDKQLSGREGTREAVKEAFRKLVSSDRAIIDEGTIITPHGEMSYRKWVNEMLDETERGKITLDAFVDGVESGEFSIADLEGPQI